MLSHYFLQRVISCCLKYLLSSSPMSTKLSMYRTENLLLPGSSVRLSGPPRKSRIGIDSPRTGAPSMISNLVTCRGGWGGG